jgi:hypothetical protein
VTAALPPVALLAANSAFLPGMLRIKHLAGMYTRALAPVRQATLRAGALTSDH